MRREHEDNEIISCPSLKQDTIIRGLTERLVKDSIAKQGQKKCSIKHAKPNESPGEINIKAEPINPAS